MNTRILTTSEVSINQVTIEVKVMKIGNRQVTLAVFKQLPDEPIIDVHTGELRGIPWGRVNYHIDCEGMTQHMHVVWQKGNELRRAIAGMGYLQGKEWSKLDTMLGDYELGYLIARILEGWMPDSDKPELPHWFTFQLEGESIRLYIEEYSVRNAWSLNQDNTFSVSSYAREKLLAFIRKYDLPSDSNLILHEYLLPTRQILNEHKKKWQQSYAQLEQLDQLFIAV